LKKYSWRTYSTSNSRQAYIKVFCKGNTQLNDVLEMIAFEPVGKIGYQQFLLLLLGWAILWRFLATVKPTCPYFPFLGHSIIDIAAMYLFMSVLCICSGMFLIFV